MQEQYITELSELLVEAANDILEAAEANYPKSERAKYPSYEQKYQRDIDIVKRINTKLQENLK